MDSLLIEYALFKPDINTESIDRYVLEAKKSNVSNMFISPYWVKKAKRELKGSHVKVSCISGYPFGFQLTETKLFEADQAIKSGAESIALTINIGAIKSAAFEWVKIEIARFAHFMHDKNKMLGIYLPSQYLTLAELEKLCSLCLAAGSDYLIIPFSPFKLNGVKTVIKLAGSNLGVKVWCQTTQEINIIKAAKIEVDAILLSKE